MRASSHDTIKSRYPQEVRERVVRLVSSTGMEYPSQWAAITSVAASFGMSSETLRSPQSSNLVVITPARTTTTSGVRMSKVCRVPGP